MAMLVGREAWYADGCLYHGIIASQQFNPNICILRLDNGETRACPTMNLALTPQEAIDQCEENSDYWDIKSQKLRSQL